jgi:Alpha-lytic protease prodomain
MVSETSVIKSAARDVFGQDYAGLGLVDDELVVFTTSSSPEVLPDALNDVPIRRVRFNLSELDAFKLRVDASHAEALERGVVISVWGVDPATNSISIGVASDSVVAQIVLPEVIGKDVPITIHAEGIPVTKD